MVDLVWFLEKAFLAVVRAALHVFEYCGTHMRCIFTNCLYFFITALFIFNTKEAAEKFVAEDPYVSNGIVTGHSILEWSVVVGNN